MGEVPAVHASAAWQVFLKYCRHNSKNASSALMDAKMTESQLLLLVKDLGLLGRLTSGAENADVQDLFAKHASQGTNHSMPRLDYQAFQRVMQVVGQTYRVPDIWQLVASKVPPEAVDPGLLALVPELLGRLQSLEALMGERPSAGTTPSVLATVEALSSGLQGVRADMARQAETLTALEARPVADNGGLEALRLEVRSLQQGQQEVQRQLERALAAEASGEGLRRDLQAVQDQMKILQSQTGALRSSHATLSTDMDRFSELRPSLEPVTSGRLQREVEGVVEELAGLRWAGSGSSAQETLKRLHNQEQDWAERMRALEESMEQMRNCGLFPPPETATKAELATMQDQLQAKVADLAAHMEETMRMLESKYAAEQPADKDQGSAGTQPSAGAGPSPSPPPGKPSANARGTVAAAAAAAAAAGAAGAGPEGAAEGAAEGGHSWDPAARPAAGLLRNESMNEGSGGVSVASIQRERKRVQWSAEAMARAEAQEIAGKMTSIKAKVARGGLSSWDMERVQAALTKLNSRVAALERLQRMVEQLNAIGECLEILDRRQKEHKQRLATLDTNMQSVTAVSAQMTQATQEVHAAMVEMRLQKGSIAVLAERISTVESLERTLQTRVTQAHDEIEMRFKLYKEAQAVALRPSLSLNRSTPGTFTNSRRTTQPGEVLSLDSPMIRSHAGGVLSTGVLVSASTSPSASNLNQGSGRLSNNFMSMRATADDTQGHTLHAAAMAAVAAASGSSAQLPEQGSGERWVEAADPNMRNRHGLKVTHSMVLRPGEGMSSGLHSPSTSNNGSSSLVASPVASPGMTRLGLMRGSHLNSSMQARLGPDGERGSSPGNLTFRPSKEQPQT